MHYYVRALPNLNTSVHFSVSNLLKMNKTRNPLYDTFTENTHMHSLKDVDSMGTTAARLRGGSTWRHHPTPYQTHTHTNTGGHVLYMYITPCGTLNMSTEALLRLSYLRRAKLDDF